MPPATTDPAAPPDPPHGRSLADFARIEAEIAEGDRARSLVLERNRLGERAWNEVSLHWTTAIGEDVRRNGAEATLPHVYSEAFAAAQDAQRAVVPMDAADYARLVLDIQTAGAPDEPLARRRLSTADYLRLSRKFAKLLSTDPTEAARFAAVLEGRAEGGPPSSAPVAEPS